jgi:hypothetical protein
MRTIRWGGGPQWGLRAALACFLGLGGAASADPGVVSAVGASPPASISGPTVGASPPAASSSPTATEPDAPPRGAPPAPVVLSPTWDLDGLYLWLGPSGAASHVEAQWDSTIGADVTVIRVREHAGLGAIGGSFGASRWTARGGGRLWLDALAGTRVLGRMMGVSAGPILELSEIAHPRVGGSIGVWAFLGLTPYARIGAATELGMFAELGIHIALPVLRRRP